MFHYAYSMPRIEEKKVGRRVPKDGAKRGPKLKPLPPSRVTDLVNRFYEGSATLAAQAWGCSATMVREYCKADLVSHKRADAIHEALKDKITLEEAMSLAKEKTH